MFKNHRKSENSTRKPLSRSKILGKAKNSTRKPLSRSKIIEKAKNSTRELPLTAQKSICYL